MRVHQPGGHLMRERGAEVADWSWRATRRRFSTLWRLTLSDGQLSPIQSFQAILSSAKLSPVSGDVLMFGPGGLSLYTGLVP